MVAPPLIVSYEEILEARVPASTVVSLTAIEVKPVALVNSLSPISVNKVLRALKELEEIVVTLIRLILVALVFKVFKSEADWVAAVGVNV